MSTALDHVYDYQYAATTSAALAPYSSHGLGADPAPGAAAELTPAQKTELTKGAPMYLGTGSAVSGMLAGAVLGGKGRRLSSALYTGVLGGLFGAALGYGYHMYTKSQEKKAAT